MATEVLSRAAAPSFSSSPMFTGDVLPSLCANELNSTSIKPEQEIAWRELVENVNELKPLFEQQLRASQRHIDWELLQYHLLTIANGQSTNSSFENFVDAIKTFRNQITAEPHSEHHQQALKAIALQLSYSDSFSFVQIYQDLVLSNQGLLHTHLHLRARLLFETAMQSEFGFHRHDEYGNIKADCIDDTLLQIGRGTEPSLKEYVDKHKSMRWDTVQQRRLLAILGEIAPRIGIDYTPPSGVGLFSQSTQNALSRGDDDLLREIQQRCSISHVLDSAAQMYSRHINRVIKEKNNRYKNHILKSGLMQLLALKEPECGGGYEAHVALFIDRGHCSLIPEQELANMARVQQQALALLPAYQFESTAQNVNYESLNKAIPTLPQHAVEPSVKRWIQKSSHLTDAEGLIHLVDDMQLSRKSLSQTELEYVAALRRKVLAEPEMQQAILHLCNDRSVARHRKLSKSEQARNLLSVVGIQIEERQIGGRTKWVEAERTSSRRRNRNAPAPTRIETDTWLVSGSQYSHMAGLLHAVRTGDFNEVKLQLEDGKIAKQVRMKDKSFFFLHLFQIACRKQGEVPISRRNQYQEIANHLIGQKYVDINAQNKQGKTPLHMAVDTGSLDLVKFLCKQREIDLSITDKNGYTALHAACASSHANNQKMALKIAKKAPQILKQCSLPIEVEFQNKVRDIAHAADEVEQHLARKQFYQQMKTQRITPLQQCLLSGQKQLAEKLAKNAKEPLVQMTSCRNSTLHLLASLGGTEELQWLIQQASVTEAQLTSKGIAGFTPLQLAVVLDRRQKVDTIIQSTPCSMACVNQHWNQQEFGMTLLQLASHLNHLAIMSSLVSNDKVELNDRDDAGNHILHVVCQHSNAQVVQAQMNALNSQPHTQFDFTAMDENQNTLLHVAAMHSAQHVAHALTLLGTDRAPAVVTKLNHEGKTVLHQAIQQGDVDTVRALLADPNYNVNAVDANGNSPLMFAVLLKKTDMVSELLAHDGLDLTQLDPKGNNVFHLACMVSDVVGLKQIIDYLNKHLVVDPQLAMGANSRQVLDCYVAPATPANPQTLRNLLNRQNEQGQTPLHLACGADFSNRLALANELTSVTSSRAGASAIVNTSIKDNAGNTPLHLACASNHTELALHLIEKSDKSKFDPELSDLYDISSLVWVQKIREINPDSDSKVELVEADATQNEEADDDGDTIAVSWSTDFRAVNAPINEENEVYGFEVVTAIPNAEWEDNPLHIATRYENQTVANAIMEKYPGYAQATNAHGITPIQIAVKNKFWNIVGVFLRWLGFGGRGDVPGDITKLHEVVCIANTQAPVNEEQFRQGLQACTKGEASINARDDCGDTVLHVAIENNRPEIAVKILTLHGIEQPTDPKKPRIVLKPAFNPETRNANGQTPLELIWKMGRHKSPAYAELIKLLLYKGDAKGKKPDWLKEQVGAAIECENTALLEVLLKHCNAVPSVESQTLNNPDWCSDEDGNGFMHLAVKLGSPSVITTLCKCGVNPEIRNKRGELPLHMLIKSELSLEIKNACVSALLEHFTADVENDEVLEPLIATWLYAVDVQRNNTLHLAAIHEPGLLPMLVQSEITPPTPKVQVSPDFTSQSLESGGLGINEPNAQKRTVLQLAEENKATTLETIKCLAKCGAKAPPRVMKGLATKMKEKGWHDTAVQFETGNFHAVDLDGNNTIHRLCANGDVETLKYLLTTEYKDEFLSCLLQTNYEGYTPLHLAVEKNCSACVKALLLLKEDIGFTKEVKGETVFHLAMKGLSSSGEQCSISVFSSLLGYVTNNPSLATLLLKPDLAGYTPLHLFAETDSDENRARITALLKVQPGLLLIEDRDGISPLFKAVVNQQKKLVSLYLDYARGSIKEKRKGLPANDQLQMLKKGIPSKNKLTKVLLDQQNSDLENNGNDETLQRRLSQSSIAIPHNQESCTEQAFLEKIWDEYGKLDPMLVAVVLNNIEISKMLHDFAIQCYPAAFGHRYQGANLLHVACKHANDDTIIHVLQCQYEEDFAWVTDDANIQTRYCYGLVTPDSDQNSVLHLLIEHDKAAALGFALSRCGVRMFTGLREMTNLERKTPEEFAAELEREGMLRMFQAQELALADEHDSPLTPRAALTQSSPPILVTDSNTHAYQHPDGSVWDANLDMWKGATTPDSVSQRQQSPISPPVNAHALTPDVHLDEKRAHRQTQRSYSDTSYLTAENGRTHTSISRPTNSESDLSHLSRPHIEADTIKQGFNQMQESAQQQQRPNSLSLGGGTGTNVTRPPISPNPHETGAPLTPQSIMSGTSTVDNSPLHTPTSGVLMSQPQSKEGRVVLRNPGAQALTPAARPVSTGSTGSRASYLSDASGAGAELPKVDEELTFQMDEPLTLDEAIGSS
ncbi:ankyrin repeat domain-containing protein [Parashewanella curva]|uniref:Ankyrin repeat domain-containing protein n=1 Tax=Parashewanella curva TaxID=2338552 RepID=A0A3L8PZ70_9GAMM|nr:ankyrin repeat domain-containing protein [Parashewanella curva]RLV60450.1 ankyrin repeat domain-containing protein [Parashewanella curva]